MYKLIINLKTYEEGTGKNAVKIAKIAKKLEKEAKKKKVEIIICCQDLDVREVLKIKAKTYAQHIDHFDYGAHTGYSIAHALKKAGVKGSLVSHSEHLLPIKEIKKTVEMAKELKMEVCVCARDAKAVRQVAKVKPDFIAVEPAELIGGDISISTAKPQLIKASVKAAGDVPLLVGAGVKNSEDVRKGIELGAKGILVASGVVKAKNVEKEMRELLSGF